MHIHKLTIRIAFAMSTALLAGAAQAEQVINIPCRQHQDSYTSLVDDTFILVYGGRGGPNLDHAYKEFLGYTEKMTYMTYAEQSWGYCKLLKR
jgi:hypothetical protein